jgi:hypothetical protein
LIDQPADETAPRCINVYFVEAQEINPASGSPKKASGSGSRQIDCCTP